MRKKNARQATTAALNPKADIDGRRLQSESERSQATHIVIGVTGII